MKKLGLTLLFISILTTGCFFSKNAKLISASKKLDNADNFTMNVTLDLVGQVGIFYQDFDFLIDNNEKSMQMIGDITNSEFFAEFNTYSMRSDDSNSVVYEKSILTNDKWLKSTIDKDDYYKEAASGHHFITQATSLIELEPVDEKEMYEITIEQKDLGSLINSIFEMSEISFIDDEPIIIELAIEDGYLSSMTIDLIDRIDSDTDEFTEATMTITFDSINGTDVVIPQSVIDSAIEAE